MPTTKTEKATENDDDLVWAESPATGRKKEMRRDRRAILALAGWKPCEPPGSDVKGGVIVTSFPSMPVDHGAAEDGASTSQNGGSDGGAGTEKKES